MASRSKQMALYDIPSLPDSMVRQKYFQTTDIYNDPNTVANFMKETIRNTGSDAPLFEQDMPRQSRNPLSQSILNTQEHGSRYTHAPFHPELFLGDMTSDPRMSTTEPLTARMADQNKFRQERYIKGKLQDVGDVRTEGLVGNKRILRQVKQGFNNTATRMGGIFNDSNDTSVRRANPHPGNSTHKVGDAIQEDQKIYQTQGEKILPQYSTDVVSKLSNMIGVQWDVQPEQKYGLSSVSNVYRSKQDVDQSKNAVFRLGQQEMKFKTEKTDIKNAANVKSLDSFKAARKDAQNVVVLMKKDSMKNKMSAKMLPPQGPINLVDRFVGTQASKRQIETKGVVNKFHTGQNRVESLVEPIKEIKSVVKQRPATIPIKDRLIASYNVSRTHKSSFRNEDQAAQRSIGYKMMKAALTNRIETKIEPQKVKDHHAAHFSNSIPVKAVDHVSNVRTTKSKFAEVKEQTATNRTGSNVLPTPSSMDDFMFDTDPTMNNDYHTQRGYSQRMTRLSEKQEQDNQVSPLNDTVAPFRTKYAL